MGESKCVSKDGHGKSGYKDSADSAKLFHLFLSACTALLFLNCLLVPPN